jgi:hypothetical protein
MNSNNTFFPPSPPPSPPQHIHKQLPIRSYIPSEDQIIDAIGTAKLAMGRNQGSLAKVGSISAQSGMYKLIIAGLGMDSRKGTNMGNN